LLGGERGPISIKDALECEWRVGLVKTDQQKRGRVNRTKGIGGGLECYLCFGRAMIGGGCRGTGRSTSQVEVKTRNHNLKGEKKRIGGRVDFFATAKSEKEGR